jgi:hypothetical protein
MKKTIALKTSLVLLSCVLLAPITVAQQAAAPEKLAGTWTVVETPEIHPDGTRAQTFGPNPKGILMIDESGQYSLQLFQPVEPSEAATATAPPRMSSHFGHLSLDPAHGVILFRIEQSSNPKWDGTEQKRQYHLDGDVLTYQVPASANAAGITAISTWRRVR